MADDQFSESSTNILIPIATPPLEGRDRDSKSVDLSVNLNADDRGSSTTLPSTKIHHQSVKKNENGSNNNISPSNHSKDGLSSNYEFSHYDASRSDTDNSLSKGDEFNHENRVLPTPQPDSEEPEDPHIDFDAYGTSTSLVNDQISKFWMNFIPGSTRPRQRTQNYSFEMVVAAKAEDQ